MIDYFRQVGFKSPPNIEFENYLISLISNIPYSENELYQDPKFIL